MVNAKREPVGLVDSQHLPEVEDYVSKNPQIRGGPLYEERNTMSSIFFDSPKAMTETLRQSARKQLDSYAEPWINCPSLQELDICILHR